ncbi:MAG TPA: ABC transporter substrate-binding protein, partial [Pseudobacillus sp.]
MYKNYRTFILAAMTVVGLASLAGCSEENSKPADSSQKKQLIYGMDSEIEKLNPVLDESQEIDTLLFRGLTKLDKENQVTPDLAKSWEISEDQLTYTFTLRQDAKWQDGKTVTARDVKFTFDQIKN